MIMKNILLVYYTQTGQLKRLADSVLKHLAADEHYNIDYFKIEPKADFPFPWTDSEFYDVMPESVKGIPVPINSFNIKDKNYDLVVLAYQVWFLSPSIPFWSLLEDDNFKNFLNGKNVITILGIRNMWVNAHNRVHRKLKELNSNHIGNIVYADPNNNLVSALTVLKYLTTGKKKPFKILPPFGILDKDIDEAQKFGKLIKDAIENEELESLQGKIYQNKGVFIKFTLTISELAAGKIFNKWANFILAKGKAKDPARKTRLSIYKVYLLILIFAISPISSLIFFIISILFNPFTSKMLKRIALLE